jgi:hypothetical protein
MLGSMIKLEATLHEMPENAARRNAAIPIVDCTLCLGEAIIFHNRNRGAWCQISVYSK